MHVYHFGAYEPGTLKRLMGMHATREDEIDRMLRAGVLVDLHQAFKQGVRASVEEYSLKKIEAFYGFERKTLLEKSRSAMRYVEHRLELGRSEEHTSELQSQSNLVCRLLLEKKKKNNNNPSDGILANTVT